MCNTLHHVCVINSLACQYSIHASCCVYYSQELFHYHSMYSIVLYYAGIPSYNNNVTSSLCCNMECWRTVWYIVIVWKAVQRTLWWWANPFIWSHYCVNTLKSLTRCFYWRVYHFKVEMNLKKKRRKCWLVGCLNYVHSCFSLPVCVNVQWATHAQLGVHLRHRPVPWWCHSQVLAVWPSKWPSSPNPGRRPGYEESTRDQWERWRHRAGGDHLTAKSAIMG